MSNARRTFVKTLAAGAAGAAFLPASSYARILGANERIQVGLIGLGGMGRGHLRNLLKEPDARVAALCDVHRPALEEAGAAVPDAQTASDFRRLLDHPDLDAVVVATPDHWHALPTVLACEAGKDVYVEKPIAVTIREGRKMVEAARRTGRVVQVGTQQRSGDLYAQTVEIIRSGRLGPVSFVRTWNYYNDWPDGIGNPPDGPPPPELDWEMWLGPAPDRPYNVNRFDHFRHFWDYAGGNMTDWGTHHLDIVQWAMDVDYPEAVSATGGKFALLDNRETPDTFVASFAYPGFICTYESRLCNGLPVQESDYGIQFHGAAGTLFVNRSVLRLMPEQGSSLEPLEVKSTGGDHARHMRDFLDCIKSRAEPRSPIETGHRASSTAMLGNIAYRTGRRIAWDGPREEIAGDPEAARLLGRDYRAPWHL